MPLRKVLVMKHIATVSSLALALAISSTALAANVTKTVSSGVYASLDTYSGNEFANLSVYKSGHGADATAWLSMYSSSCTDDGVSFECTGSSAFGDIPADDFSVNGQSGNAELHTDTTGLVVEEYTYGCDYNTGICYFDYSTGAGGAVDVEWSRTSFYEYKTNGRSEVNYMNYRYVSQGRQTYSSAGFSGVILGVPVSGEQGSVGTGTGMSLTIERTH